MEWYEIHDGDVFDRFFLISSSNDENGNFELVLQREEDGLFVRLTAGRAFIGDDIENINDPFLDGFWADQNGSKRFFQYEF